MLFRPTSIIGIVYLLGVMVPVGVIIWLSTQSSDFMESFDPAVFVLGLLSTIIGYGIWKIRPWGYYSYLASAGFVFICLFYRFSEVPSGVDFLVFVSFAAFMYVSSFFLRTHTHAPYFNPDFTWGRRDPRFQVDVNMHFEVNGQPCIGGLFDISSGGCFVALDTTLNPGDNIDFRIRMKDFDVNLRAKVVRECMEPKGYGLMFVQQTKDRRRLIQNIINYLRVGVRGLAA